MKKISVLDFLLFPKSLYKSLSEGFISLYFGIFFVGAIDLSFFIYEKWKQIFFNSSLTIIIYNVILTLTFLIFIGFINVIFFTVPLYDFLKFFRLESDFIGSSNKLIKLMKVYIVSHVLVLPHYVFILVFYQKLNALKAPTEIGLVLVYLYILLPVLFSAAIVRGINSIFSLSSKIRGFLLLIVFAWNVVLDVAFEEAIVLISGLYK